LFYSKSDEYTWNKQFEIRDEKQISNDFPHIESGSGRRFKTAPLHAPGIRYGPSGQSWKGMVPPPNHHWRYKPETLDDLDAQGKIIRSSTGNPREKIYADESAGYAYQDIWTGFKDTSQNLYPTQKNEDLLDLIIRVSSNPGDLILDCFGGSGTTAVVAEREKRRWIVGDWLCDKINFQ
jgi:adenine-specific DNA-methyltransferase